jgi:hypothetical protein
MKHIITSLLLIICLTAIYPQDCKAQHSEIGISIVLSGAIMFGPYYRYWIDDHNVAEVKIAAAVENKLIIPFACSGSYYYYFLDKHWRPSAGAQYTLLISPKGPTQNNKRKCFSMISAVPGIQYRWKENNYGIEEKVWIAYLMFKGNHKIFPIGLETLAGYSFQ